MNKGYFTGIARTCEHAFAKKGRPKSDPIKPAYQLIAQPSFYANAMSTPV
ncbi:hypothetical protein PsB1_1420 [Candidatus Phycosocius spiralis]|uniref:Uncharacterized protein n=1 Tax=Candidatus Phycosocius spiralis TaxID=2815099 RepID=A0ABQ4PWB5_9PROT|nr:hypothetical protein PsB1_1420 [Candidatus Phycosocius spiralis]